jgi:DNA primase
MKIRLRKKSALDRRLDRVLRQHRGALKLPSMDVLKAELSVERVIARCLGAEPETIHNEPRWCCPFHADTHPSLWARDEKRRWGCHPCGVSGDIFDFMCRYHEIPLRAAVGYLQRHYEDFRL